MDTIHFTGLPTCFICGELVITIDAGYFCNECEFWEGKMALTTFENVDGLTKKAVDRIDEFLERIERVGKDTPVKSRIIENRMDLRGVEVRAIVNFLRKKGYPIGSSSKGYWFAKSKDEIEETLQHLHQRKSAIQSVINGLESSNYFKKQESLFN